MSRTAPDDAKLVAVSELPGRGRGVVAGRPIAAGESVLFFRGERLPVAEIRDFTHALEVAPGEFLGPSGGIDDLVNHSCAPNCAVEVRNEVVALRALRAIAAGEELTYDYSTAMLTDPTRFDCSCGAADCRGTVTPWSELPSKLRMRQLARRMVPDFVARAQ